MKIKNKNLKFIDLCCGIGGMRIAFEQLGLSCVFASEIDKFCKKTYFDNFGDIPSGDITQIPTTSIPNHDIMLAGFPCQPFSVGGEAIRKKLKKPSGLYDEKGRVILHILKIISKKKPSVVFFENVPRLKTYDDGKIFNMIVKKLEKLGYTVHYKILSSEFIVPQKRKRLYIVAFKNKSEFQFPEFSVKDTKLGDILQKDDCSDYCITKNVWKWLRQHAKKHKKLGNGFGYSLADINGKTRTLSCRYKYDGSEILIPTNSKTPRKLTPRECARLMGFPEKFKICESRYQAYNQFGNSVVVPMIKQIGATILKNI